jgi:hypothetical protein
MVCAPVTEMPSSLTTAEELRVLEASTVMDMDAVLLFVSTVQVGCDEIEAAAGPINANVKIRHIGWNLKLLIERLPILIA